MANSSRLTPWCTGLSESARPRALAGLADHNFGHLDDLEAFDVGLNTLLGNARVTLRVKDVHIVDIAFGDPEFASNLVKVERSDSLSMQSA